MISEPDAGVHGMHGKLETRFFWNDSDGWVQRKVTFTQIVEHVQFNAERVKICRVALRSAPGA